MPIYVYIDDSGKLFNKERYQNFTAVVFTDWRSLNNFKKKFSEAKKVISKECPELMTESGKEIKGSELWRKRGYAVYQDLLLEALTGKGNYVNVFSQGVDLINFEENYWQNDGLCLVIWTKMKKWLIDDLVIQYNKHLINRWYEKSQNKEKKVIFEIHIDKETAKNKFGEEIRKRLEETANEKIKITVKLDLDSKNFPGIQIADIIANGLQRDYKKTGRTSEFRKHFKKKTNFKINISKTWKKLKN